MAATTQSCGHRVEQRDCPHAAGGRVDKHAAPERSADRRAADSNAAAVLQGDPGRRRKRHAAEGGAATVSVFGTLFSDVALDTTPAIAPIDAARIIEKAADASSPFGASPTLVIVPSPAGTFPLTYKATVANAMTYYVDALTGDVVRVVDEKNYDTGLGTGTLGDPKKMATTLIGGTYRTKDTLRPAGISTYDTGGSSARPRPAAERQQRNRQGPRLERDQHLDERVRGRRAREHRADLRLFLPTAQLVGTRR